MKKQFISTTDRYLISPRAFTLLEMIIVVMICSTVAGGVVYYIFSGETGSPTQAAQIVTTKTRMQNIKKAILQFQQDTGYMPNFGAPFRSEQLDLNELQYINGNDPAEQNPSPILIQQWADHPANLWQLTYQPKDIAAPSRWDWNKSNQRGWQGPYLSGFGSSSYTEPVTQVSRIRALHDSFTADNHERANTLNANWLMTDTSCFENPPSSAETQPRADLGMPILFEKIVSQTDILFRLTSAGPDRLYDTESDNIYLEVARFTK